MSTRGPRPPSSPRRGSPARALAIPVAVFLAVAGCLALVVALVNLPVSEIRVVAQQENGNPGPGGGREPEPSPSPPRDPPATAQDEAGPRPQPVPPEAYNGASTEFGVFLVEVETAHTDTTITDGVYTSETAPEGMEYHVYRINVTNQGTGPAFFDTYGTLGLTTDGLEYANDTDAEYVVAWDYFWDDINPGETVTTHIVFLAPEGTEFAEVRVGGRSVLEPAE
ncbi:MULTISPECIES: DUF4352 domain-containing protein [unclassified Nocardiopsis]|uniref:DUF4352 domain-containing protein n=1 Tax=unclassified Nocardiopsis TaxID=2649073 RepID=UPI001F326D37|nr:MULTISPECIES: DUF4352 domain-containing protein [unclassified Nocardiopsis]